MNIAKKPYDKLLRVYASIFEKITNLSPNLKIGYVAVCRSIFFKNLISSPQSVGKTNLQTLESILRDFYDQIRGPDVWKPSNALFYGLGTNLLDPQEYIIRFFIVMLVFLKSKNTSIANFKVKEEIWKFRKNRCSDPQIDVVAIFNARFVYSRCQKHSLSDFGLFLLFWEKIRFFNRNLQPQGNIWEFFNPA